MTGGMAFVGSRSAYGTTKVASAALADVDCPAIACGAGVQTTMEHTAAPDSGVAGLLRPTAAPEPPMRRLQHSRFGKRVACLVAIGMLLATTASTNADDSPTNLTPIAATPAAAVAAGQDMELLKVFFEEFVAITPGQGKFPKSFQMGSAHGAVSEVPVHSVTFEYSFAMSRYEVTQNLYQFVMGENPSRWKGPRNSAEMMDWNDAQKFCEKITNLLRQANLIKESEEIRLPTEAEWEYCCRAGTKTAYSFGDKATRPDDQDKKASILDAFGWHTGNAAGNDPPVGALKPNPWGLYDMHGYLWEFVSDTWHNDYTNCPVDGSSWETADESAKRVIRGGSWQNRYESLRSSARVGVPQSQKSDAIGFRCVKSSVKRP